MADPIIKAIDLGYGNVKTAERCASAQMACRVFPAIAPLASERDLAVHKSGRRNTVVVPVGGLHYEVGPDAHLVQSNFTTRNLDNEYVLTDEYLALAKGALRYMTHHEAIDLLMVGLPVNLFKRRKAELTKRMQGKHDLGGGLSVEVRRVEVMAQPMGAFMSYAVPHQRRKEMLRQRNLLMDAGWRTFDWLATQGLKTLDDRSDAVDKGMYNVLEAIAGSVERALDSSLNEVDYFRIDQSLRKKGELRFFGRPFDIAPHLPAGKKVVRDAITALKRLNKDGGDIDNLLLAGGGQFFYADEIAKAYPKHQIIQLDDPLFANVRGFLIGGQEWMAAEARRARAVAIEVPLRGAMSP